MEVDEYPQPRPVAYCNWDDEPKAQTLTLPVRSGPPRYPPAPPMAGDSPDPFDRRRAGGYGARSILGTMSPPSTRFAPLLVGLYAASAGFAFVQLPVGGEPGLLIVEVLLGIVVVPSLWWLSSKTYRTALWLAAITVVLGVVFSELASPVMVMAVATILYLLRPSLRRYYEHMAEVDAILRKDPDVVVRRTPGIRL